MKSFRSCRHLEGRRSDAPVALVAGGGSRTFRKRVLGRVRKKNIFGGFGGGRRGGGSFARRTRISLRLNNMAISLRRCVMRVVQKSITRANSGPRCEDMQAAQVREADLNRTPAPTCTGNGQSARRQQGFFNESSGTCRPVTAQWPNASQNPMSPAIAPGRPRETERRWCISLRCVEDRQRHPPFWRGRGGNARRNPSGISL